VRQSALRGQQNAQGALAKAREGYDKVKLTVLNSESREAQNNMFADISKEDGGFVKTQIDDNDKLIKEYTAAKADLLKQSGISTGASVVIQELSDNMGIPHALPDPTASQEKTNEDYFTPITVEISSTSDTQSSKQEASSLSFGASASYGAGPWSVNASVNHSQSEAHAEAMSELANAAVKISFECMRVDIGRAWLRPELFYDEDLVLGPSGPQ
jgi:flagellar motor switch/type III secretory pathway protein FliN